MEDEVIRGQFIITGWICSKCRGYNGAQRMECSECDKPLEMSQKELTSMRKDALSEIQSSQHIPEVAQVIKVLNEQLKEKS